MKKYNYKVDTHCKSIIIINLNNTNKACVLLEKLVDRSLENHKKRFTAINHRMLFVKRD